MKAAIDDSFPSEALNGVSKIDAIVLAGTYTNPKRFIRGESCKAMVPFTRDGTEQPLVYYPVHALLASPHIGKVIVVGPKDRLEDRLKQTDVVVDLYDSSRCQIVQEPLPGESEAIIGNVKRGYEERDSASPLVIVAGCDAPYVTGEAVDDILRTYFRAIREDFSQHKRHRRLADIYWTFARIKAEEDMGVGMTSRLPVILGPDDEKDFVRINFMHLFNIENLLPYEEVFRAYLDKRKTSQEREGTNQLMLRIIKYTGALNLRRGLRFLPPPDFSGKLGLGNILFTRISDYLPQVVKLKLNTNAYKARQARPEAKQGRYVRVDLNKLRCAAPFPIHPVITGKEGSKGSFDIDNDSELNRAEQR